MITQTAEYAIRAVVCLAANDGGPMTSADIAGRVDVPSNYMGKVLGMLTKAGITEAQRGVGGGAKLALPLEQITLLDILGAVDARPRRVIECPLKVKCHGELCPVHRLIDETAAEVERRLGSRTIADLLPTDPDDDFC